MYNHYGEYFGYLLANKVGLEACPVDLVLLHDYKNKYSKSLELYRGCASHSLRKDNSILLPGEVVINKFMNKNPEEFKKLMAKVNNMSIPSIIDPISISSAIDENIDISIVTAMLEVKDFEKNNGNFSEAEIEKDMKKAAQYLIDMTIYDCIFGNSDRHSQNWSMELEQETGKARIYPAYDNEAVLGLRKSEREITQAMESSKKADEYSDRVLFSRMGFGSIHSGVKYEHMLQHLIDTYPDLAIPSINRIISNIDEVYIQNLYDGLRGISKRGDSVGELNLADELPEQYISFGTRLINRRLEFTRDLLKKYNLEISKNDLEREY